MCVFVLSGDGLHSEGASDFGHSWVVAVEDRDSGHTGNALPEESEEDV